MTAEEADILVKMDLIHTRNNIMGTTKNDLLDIFIAIFDKIGYTQEIAEQIQKECGSKLVSTCLLYYLERNGFVVPMKKRDEQLK